MAAPRGWASEEAFQTYLANQNDGAGSNSSTSSKKANVKSTKSTSTSDSKSGSSLTDSDYAKFVSNSANNNQESLANILAQLQSSAGNVSSNYAQPAYTDVTNTQIKSAADLNALLGTDLTYDRQAIENIYNTASKSAYDASINEQSNVERLYNANMATNQNTALDTLRQGYGSAIASGASKGMQAANVLSAILGTSQVAGQEATKLAQDRQQLGLDYAAELKKNGVDALKYANDTASQIGTLSHQFYNDDIQAKTAELSYNQGINTDAAGLAANQYTANTNLNAQLAAAAAGVYNNNNSANATKYTADAENNSYKYAADASNNATKYAANKSYAATKLAAGK